MAINAYFHITAAGAGLKDGSDWDNAMDEAAFETHLEGAVVAGDVHFVKDGVYTFDSDILCSTNGSGISPIAIIGVKAGTTNEGANITYSDWSIDEADKPFFDMVTFEFDTQAYYEVRNIYFQGSDTRVLFIDYSSRVENCKVDNDVGSSSNKYAIYCNPYTHVYNNEILSANGNGLRPSSSTKVKYNYIHDCPDATNGIGIELTGDSSVIEFNIIDNCTIGIKSSDKDRVTVENNTFYNCPIGISETIGQVWSIVNNIFSDCVTAPMSWGAQTDINFIWSNHIHNCGANVNIDEATCFQDYELVIGDPLFTNAGVDFSLQAGSPCLNAGMSEILGVGL